MFLDKAHSSPRTGLRKVVLTSLVLLTIMFPRQMSAWGNTGHEAVAYIAWQQMSPEVRSRVMELLKLTPTLHNPTNTKSIAGYTDWVADLPAGLTEEKQNLYLFMRAATWADSIKHEWLHDSDTPPAGLKTEVNIGYTDTASHGYWHFVDRGFASDKSEIPNTPVPNAATQVIALRQAIASNEEDNLKSYDLIWLLHLVGDVHQPLHGTVRFILNKGDEGGNSVTIAMPAAMRKTFEGAQSKSYPRELHAFWDDMPGEGEPAAALSQAVSFAKPLPQAPAAGTDIIDPCQWAAESFNLAQTHAYISPIAKGLKTAGGTAYMITQPYYDAAIEDAKSQIALAGARLAKLLNDNLL